MSSEKIEELRKTVERYKKALAYLDAYTPFTYQKFVETHRIAGLAMSESEMRHKWDMSEMMIEGTEGLRQVLRDSLIDAINTLEPLIDQLALAGTSRASATRIQESPLFHVHAPIPKLPINNWALASFILSLLSLCGGLLTSVPAIVLGFVALRKIDASEGQTRGKELAWTGIIVGSVLAAISIFLILVALLSDISAR